MTKVSPVVKDQNKELPVPPVWRQTLVSIVEAFKQGDYQVSTKIPGVAPISKNDALFMKQYVEDYGEELTSLPEESWETSIYLWMGDYWEVLVDLFTLEEGLSDLVLHVRVRETGSSYRYEVWSLHVP